MNTTIAGKGDLYRITVVSDDLILEVRLKDRSRSIAERRAIQVAEAQHTGREFVVLDTVKLS